MNTSATGELIAQSRREEGYTQEQAAEMLGVSVRTLQAYEYGERSVPDDVVAQMARVYRDKQLALRVLESNPLWSVILPEVPDADMPCASLGVLYQAKEVQEEHDGDIYAIMRDGRVNREERPTWNGVMKHIDALISCSISLLVSDQEYIRG